MADALTNGDYADSLGIEINDEDGLVDKRTKQHIVNLRIEIDNDERELFVNWPKEQPQQYSELQAVQQWSVSVKQYLRAIKRLWHDEGDTSEVRNVDYYWQEKKIASYDLVPPDKDGYRFSLIGMQEMDANSIRRRIGLPQGAEVPKPVTISINGLEEVLNRDRISHSWTVYVDKSGAPPNWDDRTLTREIPLPRELLSDAVEVADDFLQQAGIGFKIGNDLPSWGYEDLGNAVQDDDITVI